MERVRQVTAATSVLLVAATGVSLWTAWAVPVLALAAGVVGRRNAIARSWVVALAVLAVPIGLVVTVPDLVGSAWPLVHLGLVVGALLVPYELGRDLDDRTTHRELGWQLAAARESGEQARVAEARARERGRIAGEMHDSLGHDVAMIALQCSALEVELGSEPGLDPRRREQLATLRSSAADVVDRLHDVVALLEDDADRIARTGSDLARTVERARAAGMDVAADIDDLGDVDSSIGDVLERVVEEGLTNAAVHAPGAAVTVRLGERSGWAVVEVIDDGRGARPDPARRSGGRGLPSLAARVRRAGGALTHDASHDGFRLRAEVPLDPPVGVAGPSTRSEPSTTSLRVHADEQRRSGTRRLVTMATAVVLLTLAALVSVFVYLNVASVLPAERAAQVPVGAPVDAIEPLLPSVEMPDAPRDRPGCRYYEDGTSFFERVDVHEICLDAGRVASVTTIAPDGP